MTYIDKKIVRIFISMKAKPSLKWVMPNQKLSLLVKSQKNFVCIIYVDHVGESHDFNDRVRGISCLCLDKTSKKT